MYISLDNVLWRCESRAINRDFRTYTRLFISPKKGDFEHSYLNSSALIAFYEKKKHSENVVKSYSQRLPSAKKHLPAA